MKVEIGVLDVNEITERQWNTVESKRELHELVNEHKSTIWYSIEEFVINFNLVEIISDNTLISWRIK